MGLRINTNVASLVAQRSMKGVSSDQTKSFQRLASGSRITSAGDDAAGLSISENIRGQVRSMSQAERNANDGISFVQVAEGGLTEMSNMLIRMRELAIQAGSDTVGDKERGFINKEIQSLVEEVDRISQVTNFNGTPLLNGQSEKGHLEFQVGIRADESDRLKFNVKENDVRAESLGIHRMDYSTVKGARDSLEVVDKAMGRVFESRARLGAMQNKLQATVNNIGISKDNLEQARSRIADTDIASETSALVRSNILQAASTSVLAQANSTPQQALKLL